MSDQNIIKKKPKGSTPKIRGKADIILCVDATGSMTPTREGLIKNLNQFIDNLVATNTKDQAPIDWRVKFFIYRDVDADKVAFKMDCPWIKDADELKQRIDTDYVVDGGGDAPESTLDAIYKSVTAGDWQQGRTKILIVFTDADTKELSSDPKNGVVLTAQEINANSVHVFLFAPETKIYKDLESKANNVIYTYEGIDFNAGLGELDWKEILEMAAKTISQYSVSIEK